MTPAERSAATRLAMEIDDRRDAAEAEDLVHDVFVALWDKASDFDDNRGSAFSWAVTLIRNRAIDRVRDLDVEVVEHEILGPRAKGFVQQELERSRIQECRPETSAPGGADRSHFNRFVLSPKLI